MPQILFEDHPEQEVARVSMPYLLLWYLANDAQVAQVSRLVLAHPKKYTKLTLERALLKQFKKINVLVYKKPVYRFSEENGLESVPMPNQEVSLHRLFSFGDSYGGAEEYLSFVNHSWLVQAKKQAHAIVSMLHSRDMFFAGLCRLDNFFVAPQPSDPILLDFGLSEFYPIPYNRKNQSQLAHFGHGTGVLRDKGPLTIAEMNKLLLSGQGDRIEEFTCIAHIALYDAAADDSKSAIQQEEQGQLQDWFIRLALHLRIWNMEDLYDDRFDRMLSRATNTCRDDGPTPYDILGQTLFY